MQRSCSSVLVHGSRTTFSSSVDFGEIGMLDANSLKALDGFWCGKACSHTGLIESDRCKI